MLNIKIGKAVFDLTNSFIPSSDHVAEASILHMSQSLSQTNLVAVAR